MRVLLVGTGGREHALAAALAADTEVDVLICAPGNPGMAEIAELRAVDMRDPDAIAALAVEASADLVVIGPEAPLVAGAADAVRGKGIACYGPSAAAAAIEGSKSFAKEVMAAAGVPTARAITCRSAKEAAEALNTFAPPYVVKDDTLAAGKGVVVTDDRDEALNHAVKCEAVVVEEFLDGPEVSLFVVCDGVNAVPMLPAQDFKRIGDGGTGPNTGGMGAYAPLPWAPDGLVDDIMSSVVEPTLAQLSERGAPFVGTLYCGLALTADGPKVIEFNCRFGDPEIQAVLAMLDQSPTTLLDAAARGRLADLPPLRWREGAAVCLVLASPGYPQRRVTGGVISGADVPGVLHAGTARDEQGRLVSCGGRVLNVVAPGADLAQARRRVYALAAGIDFPDALLRTDIALAASEGRIVAPGAYPGDVDEELDQWRWRCTASIVRRASPRSSARNTSPSR